MEGRSVHSKRRYIWAFLIGTFIFLAIFGVSQFFLNVQYQRVSESQGITAYSIFEDKMLYTFFGEDICSETIFNNISEQLGFQGKVINDLEKRFGKGDERVLNRKKFYTIILLEHFDFIRQYNEKCEENINTILFFYSNIIDATKSETSGRILDSVYLKSGNVMIYSFDVDLDSIIMDSLKDKYGIVGSPFIVVNENEKISYPFNVEDITKYLV